MSTTYIYEFDLGQFAGLFRDEYLASALGPSQLKRANRRKGLNTQFLLRRHVLKQTLSHHCNIAVADLELDEQIDKPPRICALEEAGYFFSISHSGQHLAIAIRHGQAVGVDIEQHKKRSFTEIASHIFHSKEVTALQACPGERQQAFFYKYWTSKEAFIKLKLGSLFDGRSRGFYLCEPNVEPESKQAAGYCWHKQAKQYTLALACTSMSDVVLRQNTAFLEIGALENPRTATQTILSQHSVFISG